MGRKGVLRGSTNEPKIPPEERATKGMTASATIRLAINDGENRGTDGGQQRAKDPAMHPDPTGDRKNGQIEPLDAPIGRKWHGGSRAEADGGRREEEEHVRTKGRRGRHCPLLRIYRENQLVKNYTPTKSDIDSFGSTYNLIYLTYLLKKVNEGCLLTIMNNHLFGFSSSFDQKKARLF